MSASNLTSEYRHIPVMLQETLAYLNPKPGEIVCDCTLGAAGHTVALAERICPDGLSIGIDQDDAAIAAATQHITRACPTVRYRFLQGNFSQIDELLLKAEVVGVDCVLFDLGVSSPQLDIPSRGFSYHENAPLDMRMDPRNNTLNAAEVINTYNEADLTRILRVFGDEKFAPQIARRIVKERQTKAIETTFELVDIIKASIPAAARRHAKHPARKTFQAIRIEVNHELDVLQVGLERAIAWLNTGGRMCVISYHSLEDRLVKHVFAQYARGCVCPVDLPVCVCHKKPIIDVITKKPLYASDEEVARNPRARSACMRVCKKL